MRAKSETRTSDNREEEQDTVRVILKGEMHFSREDHEEEIELIREDIDALVLEGGEKEAEYGIFEGWFQQATAGMFYVLSPLYISKELLIQFAKLQGVDIYFTRQSDAEILRNAPRLVRWFSGILYFLLLPGSIFYGLIRGYLQGAIFLFLSFGIPVLIIRTYNMRFLSGEKNRNRIMAGKIQEALEDHDLVLAIVGNDHADGVMDAIPDDVEVDYYPPKSVGITASGIWDFTVRSFKMFSLLFFLYMAILWIAVNFILPLP